MQKGENSKKVYFSQLINGLPSTCLLVKIYNNPIFQTSSAMLDLFSFQFNLNTADNNNANANTNNNNGNVVNVMPPGKKKRKRRNTKADNQKTIENRSTNETESLENKCSAKNESHLAQASLASIVLLQV